MAADDVVMSEAQRSAVFAWLRAGADVLGLDQWELIVDTEPPPRDTGALADTTITGPYRQAVIRVMGDALLDSDWRIGTALTHELVHLLHGDVLDALGEQTEHLDAGDARRIEKVVRRYIEALVDNVARAVYRAGIMPSLDTIRAATAGRVAATGGEGGPRGGPVV